MGSPEIIVIGAGIIGASLSWRLAQAGRRVELVDAGGFGSEASWAGAGMLAPGGEVEHRSAWTAFALESLGMYRSFVQELQDESGVAIDYQELGAVEIARTADEWRVLEARTAAQRDLGIPSETLPAAQLRQLVPLLAGETAGALYYPRDALVDPRDVLRALRAACGKHGVGIQEHRAVTAIHAGANRIDLETGLGPMTAAAAVLAAGAWSGGIPLLVNGERQPIPASFPVRGHLLGYRLEAGSLGPILRHEHTYLLQRAGGYTVAGTSSERVGFRRDIDARIVDDIARRAGGLVPALRTARGPEPWVGFRPASDGQEPEIGRLAGTSLWLCYGHYRNGILLAPATARRVSHEITASWGMDSTLPGASR
jgi:glycine oxidase